MSQDAHQQKLNFSWLAKMAWRDSRKSRGRLFLFVSSIILGIAALTATFSLGENVIKDIDAQARELVGADLVVESNKAPDPKTQAFIDSLGDEQSRERTFASMIYFTGSGGTRLVQVHAIEGAFPFYGEFITTPATASRNFRAGAFALVDKTLMLQYQAKPGDSIRIGQVVFVIAGALDKAPGRTELSTTIAPPVYIPLRYLEKTGLSKKGSIISYSYYFKYRDNAATEQKLLDLEPKMRQKDLRYETVASRKQRTGSTFADFSQFLTLISFVSLLLGCIGVASSIHIYMKEKISSIAILRCLGASHWQAFGVYLLQVAGVGLAGSIAGSLLGIIIQQAFPAVLKDFVPVEINAFISWSSLLKGILLGLLVSVLFALLPLISIRKISPALTLRLSVEVRKGKIDFLQILVYGIIFFFITGFTRWQIGNWPKAFVFTLSVAAAFLFLAATGWLLRWSVRRFFPAGWNYLWRQAFANLYRPGNQTIILLTTIGLGTAFICILYFSHTILLNRVSLSGSGVQPNMVLFDIQSKQKDSVAMLAKHFQLPVMQQVPVVTMRIQDINGKTVQEIKEDTTSRDRRRGVDNELRVTYRDSLTGAEKITAGKLGSPVKDPADSIFISIDEEYARRTQLKLGDHINFNVQGSVIPVTVGSFRNVDWARMQTNFRVIFPTGVLEAAPQFHVLITRTGTAEKSAAFQREVVKTYPNISIIDLGLVLSVLDDVLSKVGFVIRFMAGFSIFTGLIVLISSVLTSKYQRMQESVLLRTLGASRRQIFSITALEYFFLGGLAAASGILLSIPGTWAFAKYGLESSFSPSWWPIIILFFSVSFLTVLTGLLNIREVVAKPPLEVLRKEM